MQASYIVHMLGTQLPQSFLDVRNDLGLMTLKGRLATFPEDWTGWSPLEMALLGLYVTPEGKISFRATGHQSALDKVNEPQ